MQILRDSKRGKMNKDIFDGKWKEIRGQLKDDELEQAGFAARCRPPVSNCQAPHGGKPKPAHPLAQLLFISNKTHKWNVDGFSPDMPLMEPL
jgi:hypothetical protein